MSDRILFRDVSKFYGEVLGVNRVNVSIPAGMTSLVGPNGAGKTTLMNLLTGLVKPTSGTIRVLGCSPGTKELCRSVGYCTQWDSFPKGMTGLQFVTGYLKLHFAEKVRVEEMAWRAIRQVGMEEQATGRISAYSKGNRQRIKLAQAIAHDPRVLVLDEPLNGLDPLARARTIEFLKRLAAEGRHILVSTHILHEVDLISDTVIMLDGGHVVAEGQIRGVRREVSERPVQILMRCDRPGLIASRAFEQGRVTEVTLHEDGLGLSARTPDPDGFYQLINQVVVENHLKVETVFPADESVQSVYDYLITKASL